MTKAYPVTNVEGRAKPKENKTKKPPNFLAPRPVYFTLAFKEMGSTKN